MRSWRSGRPRREGGVTYLGLLFLLAALGAGVALAAVLASTAERREREDELLFAGLEFQRAIERYHAANPKLPDRYPKELAWLLKDPNHLVPRRHLRRLYVDPMTGSTEWGLVRSPLGGIMGVHSTSTRRPIRQANFPVGVSFPAAGRYSEWRFMHASAVVPAGTAPPKPGASGGAGGPAQQQQGTTAGTTAGTSATTAATGGAPGTAAPATPGTGLPAEKDDGLRDTCEILRGADQGYCGAMQLRFGAAAGNECRGIAAQREAICKATPKGPYPPLRP